MDLGMIPLDQTATHNFTWYIDTQENHAGSAAYTIEKIPAEIHLL